MNPTTPNASTGWSQPGRHARFDERGAMTAWIAILLGFMLVGFGGLVYDGAGAATRNSEIIDAAWSLARTGANQTIADGGSGDIVVDPVAADDAIDVAAARQWPDLTITSSIGANSVSVTVSGTYEPRLLQIIGVGDWDLTATRTSTLVNP